MAEHTWSVTQAEPHVGLANNMGSQHFLIVVTNRKGGEIAIVSPQGEVGRVRQGQSLASRENSAISIKLITTASAEGYFSITPFA